MSVRRSGDLALLVVLAASALFAAARTQHVRIVAVASAQGGTSAPGVTTESTPSTLTTFRLRRSPFRLDGALPSRRFGESPPPAPPLRATATASTHVITVRAIVGGPPWQALLVGLPGEPGDRVARTGDRYGPVLVDRIERDWVLLSTVDTSWQVALPERRP